MPAKKHYYLSLVVALICAAACLLLYLSMNGMPRSEKIRRSWRSGADYSEIEILCPFDGTMFPADIAPPSFKWKDANSDVEAWAVFIEFSDGSDSFSTITARMEWSPSADQWRNMKRRSMSDQCEVKILGVDDEDSILSEGTLRFITTPDEVNTPIFYREVNLPFIDAVKDPSGIRWRFGPVSSESRPPVVLEKLPVCGNCHSFSADGAVLGMDVDYANEKGSYAIADTGSQMVLDKKKIITWSDYRRQDGRQTFGLLSQISPCGRYVISTVKDRSVFVPRDELAFSQLFFPVRGILVVYDRKMGKYASLPGADDARFVQSNPTWSPDGKVVVFARSKAIELKDDANSKSVLLSAEQCRDFLQGNEDFRFDLYRVPFNNGEGGTAEPLKGACNNGTSNYFPRFSPDGKWIVFCRAASFMLLQPDSELYIIPSSGGDARRMECNMSRMNSWHSWSPDSRWLVFGAKHFGPYTKLFLTHIDNEGRSTPPVVLDRFTSPDRAANIPEFVNLKPGGIERIHEKFVDDYSFRRAGDELMKAGDEDQAMKAYAKAVGINPGNSEAHNNLGVILMRRGKFADAEKHLSAALASKKPRAAFHKNMGDLMIRTGRGESAVKHYRNAISVDSNSIDARLNLGQILLLQRKYDAATGQFREVVRREEKNAMAHFQLARSLKHQNMLSESLKSYRKAAELAPKNRDIMLGLARFLVSAGDVKLRDGEEAAGIAIKLCGDTEDDDPEVLDVLAAAYAQSGRFKSAIKTAEKAMSIARQNKNMRLVGIILAHLELFDRGKALP